MKKLQTFQNVGLHPTLGYATLSGLVELDKQSRTEVRKRWGVVAHRRRMNGKTYKVSFGL